MRIMQIISTLQKRMVLNPFLKFSIRATMTSGNKAILCMYLLHGSPRVLLPVSPPRSEEDEISQLMTSLLITKRATCERIFLYRKVTTMPPVFMYQSLLLTSTDTPIRLLTARMTTGRCYVIQMYC